MCCQSERQHGHARQENKNERLRRKIKKRRNKDERTGREAWEPTAYWVGSQEEGRVEASEGEAYTGPTPSVSSVLEAATEYTAASHVVDADAYVGSVLVLTAYSVVSQSFEPVGVSE
jgi:hypothetical protein